MARLGANPINGLSFGETPIALAGSPRRLSGTCEMRNTSDADVFLWTVPVVNSQLRDRSGATLRDIPVMRAIPAGGAAVFPLRLKLDPLTPPGEYALTLALGDERKEVIVQVPEHQQLRIEPLQINLVGEPKAKLTQSFVVTNRGNVSVTLQKLGAVILEEDGGVCRSVQASLRAKGNDGYEPFLDALVAELATTRVDMLRVGVPDDTPAILPGESRSVTLDFHLPGDLTPGRRYFGQLAIASYVLNVQVTALAKSTPASTRATTPRKQPTA